MKGKKKFNIILALLIAMALWVYVFGQSDSTIKTTLKDVPIKAINQEFLSENGLAVGSIDNSFVNITFSGKRSVTSKITADDFDVTYDVYGLTEGTAVLNLRIASPDDITISDLSVKSVKVDIEQEETVEKPIFVKIINDNSDTTEPYVVQLSYNSCLATGGKTKIAELDSVVCELDANKVTDELQAFNVELIPVDKEGEKIEGINLSISNVSITATLASKKTVPLHIEIVGEESTKFIRTANAPKAITLKGNQDALEGISEINAGTIDISDIYETSSMPINVDLPYDVTLASDSINISVAVSVDKITIKEFTYSETDILANGIMEDVTVTINDSEVKVKIFGQANVIDNIKKEDILLSVDASGLYWGTYSLPLNISCNKTYEKIELDTKEIEVYVE